MIIGTSFTALEWWPEARSQRPIQPGQPQQQRSGVSALTSPNDGSVDFDELCRTLLGGGDAGDSRDGGALLYGGGLSPPDCLSDAFAAWDPSAPAAADGRGSAIDDDWSERSSWLAGGPDAPRQRKRSRGVASPADASCDSADVTAAADGAVFKRCRLPAPAVSAAPASAAFGAVGVTAQAAPLSSLVPAVFPAPSPPPPPGARPPPARRRRSPTPAPMLSDPVDRAVDVAMCLVARFPRDPSWSEATMAIAQQRQRDEVARPVLRAAAELRAKSSPSSSSPPIKVFPPQYAWELAAVYLCVACYGLDRERMLAAYVDAEKGKFRRLPPFVKRVRQYCFSSSSSISATSSGKRQKKIMVPTLRIATGFTLRDNAGYTWDGTAGPGNFDRARELGLFLGRFAAPAAAAASAGGGADADAGDC